MFDDDTSLITNSSFTPSTVILQVGERRFITTRDSLVNESDFFASMLSVRWNNAMEDGPYFVDADANLFEHVFRYLRRGVFPLFYEQSKGHDFGLYLALLEEARYFKIKRLEQWLDEKRYLDTVKTEYSATESKGIGNLGRSHKRTKKWDVILYGLHRTCKFICETILGIEESRELVAKIVGEHRAITKTSMRTSHS